MEEIYMKSEIKSEPATTLETSDNELILTNIEILNNNLQSFTTPQPASPLNKKRSRNEQNWARNKRRVLRALGQSYTNASGKVIPERKFSAITSCCVLECFKNFHTYTQQSLFTNFKEIGNYDGQNAYIFSQVKVGPVGRRRPRKNSDGSKFKTVTRWYFLPNEKGVDKKVCKVFFRKVLDVSDGRIDRVMKHKDETAPPKDQRGRHTPANKTPDCKLAQICSFIGTFPTHSRGKTARKFLDPGLNIRSMYRQYQEKVHKPLSEHMFREVFKTRFNLHFYPAITKSSQQIHKKRK